jgi:hypothetical protein
MTIGARTIELLSGEFMLGRRPNGGEIVVRRTIWIGIILIVAMALIRGGFGDTSSWSAYGGCVLEAVKGMFTSAEAPTIFGATYAALYARFASQWGYIANLYNQIKQAEVEAAGSAGPATAATSTSAVTASPTPSEAALILAQWKAGFIEDALAVHMAAKPSIAGVIGAWFKDKYVKDAFMSYTPHAAEDVEKLQKFKVLPTPLP